jgi:ABC-type uncharacterized transport system involved in gliding motility auxiliary subunit
MEVGFMKKFSQIAGLCGVVLLLFGIVAFMFTRDFSLYTVAHLAGGALLVVFSLLFNRGGLWSTLGERSTRYSANALLYSAIFLGLLVLVNVVSNSHSWRKDFTEAGLFSISDQSEKVLKNLDQDVDVLAFFSQGKGTKLEDLLNNFTYASDKFHYEFIDPVKQPEKAEIHDVNTNDILVVKCGDRETKITGTAEEDLTNAILKVARSEQKKIYFLAGHGERGLEDETEPGYQIIKKALENENYLVEPLKLYMHKDVPENCAVLVIADPEKPLERSELQAVDRYLNKGGNALFLINPASAPELEVLAARWGVKVGTNVVVDQVFRLFEGPTLGVDPIVEEYGEHEITKDFKGQTLFHMVASVDAVENLPQGLTVVSLAKTSPKSWAETDLDLLFEKGEVEHTDEDLSGPVSVAVAVTREIPSPGEKDEPGESGSGTPEKAETKLVVIGDADIADNQYIAKMYNADFLLNSINWLAGEEAYISVRPKTTRGSQVAMTPQQTRSIFFLSVLILPEILLLLGLSIWWRRR